MIREDLITKAIEIWRAQGNHSLADELERAQQRRLREQKENDRDSDD